MQAPVPAKSHFEDRWVAQQLDAMLLMYGEKLDVEDMKKQLHEVFQKTCYNPTVNFNNNYKLQTAKTDLINILDFVETTKPIIGGNGCLFMQPEKADNPLVAWIRELLALRKQYKKKMYQYPVGSDLFNQYNLLQLNTKIKINSMYGVLGYSKFILHNLYLAQAVTSFGQHIISSAAQGFEAFIADHVDFVDPDSVFQFLAAAARQTQDTDGLQYLNDEHIRIPTEEELYAKLMKHVAFPTYPEFEDALHQAVGNVDEMTRKLAFYKNDVKEFFRNPYFREKLRYYILNCQTAVKDKSGNIEIKNSLLAADPGLLTDEFKQINEELWGYLRFYVLDERPVYDRIRKTRFQNKYAVGYIDTDSNFLCLGKWFEFVKNEVLGPGEYPVDEEKKDLMNFTIANTFTIWLTNTVNSSFNIMGKWLNIAPEIRSSIQMKNEFFYSRIMFVKSKKRYIGRMRLKEGVVVPPSKQAEIKGFEFRKSVTKPHVREFYTKISVDKILLPETIQPIEVFKTIMEFEKKLRYDIMHGDTRYFKQANIKTIADYTNPYSMQGIKAVLLWNTLCPNYQIELPGDVDIVPMRWEVGRKTRPDPKVIKDNYVQVGTKLVKDKKTGRQYEAVLYQDNDTPAMRELEEKYPLVYAALDEMIFHNPNPEICKMGLSFIAKPKNPQIPVPQWLYDFMDIDRIVNDTLTLYNSVLESLGINVTRISTTQSHYTNMVEL